jgi:hypothetical protein
MKAGQQSGRKQGDSGVVRTTCRLALSVCVVIGCSLAAAVIATAEGPQNGGGPHDGRRQTYQRHGSDWKDNRHDQRRNHFKQTRHGQQSSSAWFQRPYPYHLDYYRMKFGGSYAPYFGNLYGTPFGTPAVVYGGWGPGAGDWEAEPGVQPQGVEGAVWVPYALPQGAVLEQPEGTSVQSGTVQPGSESLPAPSK